MKTNITSFAFFIAYFLMIPFCQAQYQFTSPCTQLVWEDNFDGTVLDAAKWTAQIGDGCDINLCGWGNNEEQYYTDRVENVKVENGSLYITALKENYLGKSYTSARIRSKDKGDFTFGRIEARIKLPQGAGSWPAFWMLPTDNVFGAWPQSGELDVMEFQGKTPTFVAATVHYGSADGNHIYKGLIKSLPTGQFYYQAFHDFAMEWDSTTVRFYMDGANYHTLTKESILPDRWPFDERFHILLNNAIGGDLGGAVEDASFPQVMEIDYVRVYSVPFNRAITGKVKVYEGEQDVVYTLPGDIANVNTYVWSVSTGSTITEGQGTKQIKVTWGDLTSSGNVSLSTTTTCDVFTLDYPVTVFQDACTVIWEDHESIHNLSVKQKDGIYYSSYNNTTPNAINSSTKVGRYKRNNTEAHDAIIFNQLLLDDVTAYEAGTKYVYLDVLSNAPVGTSITLQLQNSSKASGAIFPVGIRSTFSTVTTIQGQWERHRFAFSTLNDAAVLPDQIDEFALSFDPGNLSGEVYMFDNFKRSNVEVGCIIDAVHERTATEALLCYPNPSHDKVLLKWNDNAMSSSVSIVVSDIMGNEVLKYNVDSNAYSLQYEINVQHLPSGTYSVHLFTDTKSIVKQLIKL